MEAGNDLLPRRQSDLAHAVGRNEEDGRVVQAVAGVKSDVELHERVNATFPVTDSALENAKTMWHHREMCCEWTMLFPITL